MTNTWSFRGWYYEHAGRRAGPVRPEEIVALLQAGQLVITDPVWRVWQEADGDSWLFLGRAGQLLGLPPLALGIRAELPPSRVQAPESLETPSA